MSDLQELYHSVIIDHGRKPRNFVVSPEANCIKEGFNPLCGDRVVLYITEQQGVIIDATFQGTGCAISIASASLMTETLKGKTVKDAKQLFENFHLLITQGNDKDIKMLGKLAVLSGVSEFPARVKCATLAWHTLIAAIENFCNNSGCHSREGGNDSGL